MTHDELLQFRRETEQADRARVKSSPDFAVKHYLPYRAEPLSVGDNSVEHSGIAAMIDAVERQIGHAICVRRDIHEKLMLN
jgi:hypothetical protein